MTVEISRGHNPLRDPEDARLNRIAGPSALVIFGVTGDLSRKKLMPAVYDLANRGLLPWLDTSGPDVVLLQEVRATPEQTEATLAPALASGWHLAQAEAAAKVHAKLVKGVQPGLVWRG